MVFVAIGCSTTGKQLKHESPFWVVVDKDEPDAGQIFVDTNFDGETRRCFLDTGAKSTKIIEDSFFSKYPKSNEAQIAGLSGKSVQASRILISKVKIGTQELGQLEVVRLPQGPDVEPTLGIDLFQNQKVSFDFKDKKLSFGNTEQPTIPFKRTDAGYITLDTNIESLSVRVIFDTGAGLTTIDQKIIDQNPKVFRFLKSLSVGDSLEVNSMQLKLYEIKEAQIGGLGFQNVKVLGADFTQIRNRLKDQSIQGALGYNVLIQHNWHFDMATQKYSVY